MQFDRLRTTAKCAMFAAAAFASTAASAAVQYDLALTGNTLLGDGVAKTYTLGSGASALDVKITAWTFDPNTGKIYNSRLGMYSNGLGVTGDGETSNAPTNSHTIDNSAGVDFVIFQFSKAVELVEADFKPYKIGNNSYADADFSLASGLANFATTVNLSNKTYSNLNGLFASGIGNYGNNGTTTTATIERSLSSLLNPVNRAGNIWLVGGAFSNKDKKIDAFKFSALTVKVPVPEPSTWLMMIAGFGFIGASIRRQKRQQAVALAA